MLNHTDLTGQLLAGRKIFLVEKPISSDQQDSLASNLKAAILTIGVTGYDISPDKVSKQHLLSIWGGGINSSQAMSRYRLICQRLSGLRNGAALIYNAHQLSGESIQLFSQLIRYVEQHELNWRFIFIANPEHENFSRLSLLSKDIHVAGTVDSAPRSTLLEGSKGNARSTPDSSRVRSNGLTSSVRHSILLGVILVCAFFGYLYINSSGTEARAVIEEPSGADQKNNQLDSAVQDNSGSTQTELNDYLAVLAQKEREFEQELKAMKSAYESQEENNPTQAIAQNPTDRSPAARRVVKTSSGQTTNRLRPANALLSREVIAMISTGDVEGLKAISTQSGVFEGRDPNGQSALIASVIVKQHSVAELLIQQGVSTEFVDSFGQTALYHAAIQGDIRMTTTLVDGGANVNALTDLDKTPLMASVHNGHLEITKYLLSKGAEVNLQDHSGWSALFYATWNSRDDIIFTLKTSGASDDLRDNDGYSLAEISRYRPTVTD